MRIFHLIRITKMKLLIKPALIHAFHSNHLSDVAKTLEKFDHQPTSVHVWNKRKWVGRVILIV